MVLKNAKSPELGSPGLLENVQHKNGFRSNPGLRQKQAASTEIILPTTLIGIVTAMVRRSRLWGRP
jgi:hypothetical protein